MFKGMSQLKKYLKETPQAEAAVFYNPYLNEIRLVRNGKITEFVNDKGNVWFYTGRKLGKHDTLVGYLNESTIS